MNPHLIHDSKPGVEISFKRKNTGDGLRLALNPGLLISKLCHFRQDSPPLWVSVSTFGKRRKNAHFTYCVHKVIKRMGFAGGTQHLAQGRGTINVDVSIALFLYLSF